MVHKGGGGSKTSKKLSAWFMNDPKKGVRSSTTTLKMSFLNSVKQWSAL